MTLTLSLPEIVLAALLVVAVVYILSHRHRHPSPTDGASRVESFNLAVRSVVTVGLTAGFLWGFIVQQAIDPAIFVTMFATVLGFWFGSRDAKQRASDQPMTTVETPDTKITQAPAKGGTE